jgi:hypothetical protein
MCNRDERIDSYKDLCRKSSQRWRASDLSCSNTANGLVIELRLDNLLAILATMEVADAPNSNSASDRSSNSSSDERLLIVVYSISSKASLISCNLLK